MVDKVAASQQVVDVVQILRDWSAGSGPLHQQLADALRARIVDRDVEPGRRLPSERQLAAALAVSRTTVVTALDTLRAEGLLESRRGSGTRVARHLPPARPEAWAPGMRARALYQRIVDGPGELISLTHVSADGLPEIADVVQRVAREDLPALMTRSGYHPRGLPELRAVLADHHTRQGLPTDPEQIVVTTGAHQALALVAELYLRPGTTAVVESPCIAGCLDLMRARGAELRGVPVDDDGMDLGALREVLRARTPDLIYVMPCYHNPLGTLMSESRRRGLAEIAARAEIPVVEDHAYAGLQAAAEPAPIAAFAPDGVEVVTVGSLTKVAWTGLRIGWLRAPAAIAERASRRKILHDLGSPLLDQAVAARLVPDLDRLAKARSALLERRLAFLEERLRALLPSWRWRRPIGGSAIWVELPESTAHVLAQIALRHGVELLPDASMADGAGYERNFRLPFCAEEEVLDEAVRRLARAWSELRRHGPTDTAPARVVV